MKLFDLHSDTLFEAARRKVSPISSLALQAPLGISPFEKTFRTAAIWCRHGLDDNACFEEFLNIHTHTEEALQKEELPNTISFQYAVEDARLLSGKLDRLSVLHEKGVRVLTLLWKDTTVIGGAWNTDDGLTPFGKEVVKEAKTYDIVLDLSHASFVAAKEILALTERYDIPLIASHSNSFTVCPHKRNLPDCLFDALAERSALVGISLVPEHLDPKGATLSSPLHHIAHFLSRKGGEQILAVGSDFDGSDLPEGIIGLSDLPKLSQTVENTLGKPFADAFFYENAARFFKA